MKKEKGIIAIVDYESAFKDDLDIAFKRLRIAHRYKPTWVEFTRALPEPQMVQRCIDKLRNLKKSLAAIMVDVVIFESGAEVDLTGTRIVEKIRTEFPSLPIFLVTKHIQATREKAFQYLPIVVWSSLEDVDGVLIKQYLAGEKEYTSLIPFRGEDFQRIIDKARRKRDAYAAGSILALSDKTEDQDFEELEGFFSFDKRAKLEIRKIRSGVFKHLIAQLFPGERGTISYFRPGFSGSYLFRVNLNSEPTKCWIMKLNETDKIVRELGNYKEIRNVLDEQNYPDVVGESATYGKWGAFAVEIQDATITLADYLALRQSEKKLYIGVKLAEILKRMYGKQERRSSHLWKDHCELSPTIYLKIRALLEDQESILERYCGKDKVDTVMSFVNTQGESKSIIYEKVHWVRTARIHGDFNARNVLLDTDRGRIVPIDYANYGEGHVPKDIAKLEADCVFSVLDASSHRFYDWGRIDEWKVVLDLVDINSVFNHRHRIAIRDEKIRRIYCFVKELRKGLKEIVCPSATADEYLKILLYYSLHYIGYPDISIQKKVFLIEWCYQIITHLENS